MLAAICSVFESVIEKVFVKYNTPCFAPTHATLLAVFYISL